MWIYNLAAFRARVAAVCLALYLHVSLRCLPAGAATSVSAAQMACGWVLRVVLAPLFLVSLLMFACAVSSQTAPT